MESVDTLNVTPKRCADSNLHPRSKTRRHTSFGALSMWAHNVSKMPSDAKKFRPYCEDNTQWRKKLSNLFVFNTAAVFSASSMVSSRGWSLVSGSKMHVRPDAIDRLLYIIEGSGSHSRFFASKIIKKQNKKMRKFQNFSKFQADSVMQSLISSKTLV